MSRAVGYEPGWDIDLAYGHVGERLVEEILTRSRIEVKRKRRLDLWLYVELEHDPRRAGLFTPSGLSVTTADYWLFLIGDTGTFFVVPVRRLRSYVSAGRGRTVKEEDGDCPTRGRLVHAGALIDSRFD